MPRRQAAPARTAALAVPGRADDEARDAVSATGASGPQRRALAWRIALGCFWLMAVFLAYYAVHKPLTVADLAALGAPAQAVSWGLGQTAARLLGAAADLLAVAWLLVAAGALGQALWRALRLPLPGRAAARLVGTVLGLGALGLVAFALALVGLLRLPAALLVLGLPVALFFRDAWTQARWWWRAARGWWRAGWAAGAVERVALLFAAATSALALLSALLPPTAWDALAYHLPVVRADTAAGRIVLDPASPQGYQPQLVEMLNALLALVRGGDGAAAPLHAACGGLAVALVALLAWRAGGPRVSIRAGALALAIPLVTTIAGWAYVDLALAAAELAALLALAEWARARRAVILTTEQPLIEAGLAAGLQSATRPTDRLLIAGTNRSKVDGGHAARGWLLAAALCAGLALDIKYTAAYTLAALVPLIAFAAWRTSGGLGSWRRRILATARPAAGFAALALLVGSPWLLRNALLIGDPIFPYHLGALLPQGPGWDPGRTIFMEGSGWGWNALWRAPLLPLEATLLGTQHSVEFDATLGPLLLALLPLGLLALGPRVRGRSPTAPTDDGEPDGRIPVHHDDAPEMSSAIHLRDAPTPPSSPSVVQVMRRGVRWTPAPTPRDNIAFAPAFWRWPLAYAGVMWLIWAEELARSQVAMQGRLFLAPILALAVPAALAWTRLDTVRLPSLSLGRLANAAVILCFAFTLVGQAAQTLTLDNLAELAGAQSRPAYLAQQLGPYAAAMAYLDTLGPSARVLFLWEPRTYLTTAQAEPDAFIDNFNALYRHCGDAVGITRCLRAEGYTYVLVYREGVQYVRTQPGGHDTPAELAVLDQLLATWPLVYEDTTPLPGTTPGWYAVYRIAG